MSAKGGFRVPTRIRDARLSSRIIRRAIGVSAHAVVTMQHFIFNLADGDRERATSFLHAKRWVFGREERHRDAIAPGDLVLIFVAITREFVGRAKLATAFLDPIPSDAATSDPALSGVLLGEVEEWTSGVPLNVAVQRIDPTASNPYVQANAAGFRTGVVQITVSEYDIVTALHDEAGAVAERSASRVHPSQLGIDPNRKP